MKHFHRFSCSLLTFTGLRTFPASTYDLSSTTTATSFCERVKRFLKAPLRRAILVGLQLTITAFIAAISVVDIVVHFINYATDSHSRTFFGILNNFINITLCPSLSLGVCFITYRKVAMNDLFKEIYNVARSTHSKFQLTCWVWVVVGFLGALGVAVKSLKAAALASDMSDSEYCAMKYHCMYHNVSLIPKPTLTRTPMIVLNLFST